MKKVIISSSSDETFSVGKETGKNLQKKSVVAIYGNLGAGKTIFAKGIAIGIGIVDDITSPTFSLLEVYEGDIPLYHFDLYRIEDPNEFANLSFEEYFEGDGVSVIEWPENGADIIPQKRINVCIEYIDENRRSIAIEYPDN